MRTLLIATLLFVGCTTAKPKISHDDAVKIALTKSPGTPNDGELEDEHGHHVWSFDITGTDGKITEVQVDANTGAVVAVENETAEHEAKEKSDEAKEKTDAGR